MNHRIQLRVLSFLTVLSLILSALAIPTQQALAANAGTALQFNGSSQYVTFGQATSTLGVQTFTLEAWVYRNATGGKTMGTGIGGLTNVYPVLTKGMGEGETPANVNMNYFMGISNTGILSADFEDTANGGNHPVSGTSAIPTGQWHHIAVTYDGQTWRLYIDGVLDKTLILASPFTPESTSTQHAALATTLQTSGSPNASTSGYFSGLIDEARVWNAVRSQSQIQADMYNELTSGNGLIGRWGFNEGTGTTATNSVAVRPNGTLTNGPTWVTGFPDNTIPSQPAGLAAAPGLGYVDLAWTANGETDLAGYNIYRSTNSPVALTTPLNGSLLTSLAYHDTSAVGTNYYVVQAVDTSGNKSAASEEVSAAPLTDTEPPAAPTGLTAIGASQLLNLTWTANSEPDLAGYNLYRSATAGGAYAKVNMSPIMGTSYLDTGLTNGTAYYYVLTAVDSSTNESGYSTEVSATPAEAATGLSFTYTSNENQHVTFGQASGLGLQTFTIETWVKRASGGRLMGTGTAGLGDGFPQAYPIITKGRGQGESPANVNMNYWVGISSTGVIAADFEDTNDGLNHPTLGTTPIPVNEWHHIAVTYGGGCWSLYLDGNPEPLNSSTAQCPKTRNSTTVSAVPESTSIQHAALSTALQSNGTLPADSGFFSGVIDEARIWNYARSLTEIRSTISSELTSGSGLVARWGTNEGGGTTIASSVGSFTGTLTNGPTFVAGAPFDLVFDLTPPATPTGLAATAGIAQVSLAWDANGEADLAGYHVYRSTASPVTKGTPINSTLLSSPAFVDTGVTAGTEYFYAITALDASANESALSNEASATPQAAPPPAAPSNLNTAASGPYLVNLSWTDNSGNETGFEVERSTSGNTGPFSLLFTTVANAVSYSDFAVQPGSEYCYRLRAVNGAGQSDYTTVSCVTTPVEGEYGLDLGPNNGSHVSFGEAPALKLAQFTLEGWFKREGAGATANTGTGGFLGIPLITKGVGEAEGSNVDMNYFLGIRDSDDVVCADFEEGPGGAGPLGQNHPVCGTTVIANNTWYHVAATYDGGTWKLYLNGNPEATLAINQPVRSDSIQHAGLGVALNSTGAASGHFDGMLDEVRVWNYARTRAQILSSINSQLSTPETGLVGRWSLNEGSGPVVRGSAGTTINGMVAGTGSSWVMPGAPYNIVRDTVPPAAPTNLMGSPRPGAAQLEWTVNTEPDLAGYKVYRSTSSPVTKGTPLNSTLLVTPSFVDSGVTEGTQYFYAVAAVDTSNNESDLSNEASLTPLPPLPAEALDLGSSGAYVSFGDPAALDLAQFTIETWFKRTGAGTISTTGSNGIPSAIPLVTHGAPQADGSNLDANWMLVIDDATDVLGADFEDMATGANHPVRGTTQITNDIWHHAAATYDGTTWRLYLDGNLEATSAVNAAPRSDTTQQAALGTMLTSTAGANGRFQGVLDEARVWNHARSQAQLLSTINVKLPDPQTGLVARWGLDESTGSVVNDATGNGVRGTITGTGYNWVPGSPFNVTVNLPPEAPQLEAPADDATNVSVPVTLSVTVSDPEDQPLNLTFYGRPLQSAAGPDFTLIAIPDPQYYASTYPAIYDAQMDWVVANKNTSNIPYVISLGDNVNTDTVDPNASSGEWANAKHAWDILTAGGVPYGLTLGNHDGAPSSTANFNTVFGSRIASQPTYGGRYGTSDYDNTYATFSASGLDFIVLFIEYDSTMTGTSHPVLAWANGVLQANSTRRAIVVTHNLLQGNSFSTQGAAIYSALKANPNLFLMLGGHLDVAGQRTEVYNGNTVYALRSDYQTVDGQQSGYLRVMRFSPADDMIYVTTYSPTQNKLYDKSDAAQNNFTLPYLMQGTGFSVLETATNVPSGATTSVTWSNIDPNEQYEWFVIASDGTHQTASDTWSFTTAGATQPPRAGNDSYSTGQETTLNVAAPGVLSNDADPDGDALTAVKVTDPSRGALILNANGSFTYTPDAGFSGSDSFTYKANDGTADSNTATVSITIDPVNHAPTDLALSGASIAENQLINTVVGTLSSTDPDSGDTFTYTLVSGTGDTDNASFNISGDSLLTSEVFDFETKSSYSIRVRTTDQAGLFFEKEFTITITDVVEAYTLSVEKTGTGSGTVTSDPAGIDCGVDCSENYNLNRVVTLTATAGQGSAFTGWSGAECSGTGACTLTIDAAQSVSANFDLVEYTLTVNTVGSGAVTKSPDQAMYRYGDTVQLTAVPASGWAFSSWSSDLTGSANPGTISIDGNKTVTATFTSTNTAPVAVDDSYLTYEDTTLAIAAPGILENDTDAGPLTASKVSDPAHGAVQFNTDGSFTYTPAADYHGADSFTYEANDGSLDSNEAIVTITVAPVNDAPFAESKTVHVDEDGSIALRLSGNDPEGDALTFAVLTPPASGTLSGTPPELTYAPGLNYIGADGFTFEVSDGSLSAQADVTIHVEPVNDSPVAVADAYATDENSALEISQPGVLGNDTDVDGDPLTAILVSNVSHGVLTLDAAGSFHYMPEANFSGEDHFSYKANDGKADSSDVTVTIKVNTGNHAPTANDDDYSSDEDVVLSIAAPGVLDNDADEDRDALSAILVSGTSHGVLTLQADGSFTYAPELNWHGTDSFTYKVSDSLAVSNTATGTITVSPVNDPPVAAAQAVSVDEEGSLAITLAGSDAEGDPLTFAIATDPAHGVLSGAPPEVTYVPDADFSGNDAFTFTVNDGQASSAPAAVSIGVDAINDAPVCLSLSLLTDEDVPASLNPSCTDVDNAVLSYQIATPAQHGTASVSGSLLSYSPSSNYYGADNFGYKASDGALASNVAAVSVTVNPVNDTPVAKDDSTTTPQGTPVTIRVLDNDSDADGDSLSLTAVSTPAHGSASANPDNTVTYTPGAGWSGPDSFTYTISDGHNGTASATVNITVSQSQTALIFKDSFDTCSASAWSATTNSTALAFTNAAAWDGSCGMAVSVTTNSPAYVRDNTPAAEARYRARFYFNPNSISMAKNDAHALLNAYNGAGTPTLTVELRLSGKNYQIRAGLLSDRKKWVYTSWATLANGWQPIEVDWRASTAAGANNGGLTLWVGGVQTATLSAVDNDTQRVESVALGAVEGVDARTRGTYFFDAFESRRP